MAKAGVIATPKRQQGGVSAARVFRIRLVTIVVLLAAWECIAFLGNTGVLYADVVPSSWKVVAAIGHEFASAAFYDDLGVTFAEVSLGFVAGSIIAIALGIVMGVNPFIRKMLEPYLNAVGSTPKIIFLPIIFLFFGTGMEGKIAKGALSAFFPVVFTTALGMLLISPVLIKVGKSFNLSQWQMVQKIYIPAMINPVITGLRLAMAISVIGVLVAELKVASAGLGFRLANYYENFNIAGMYALIVIIFALAAFANIGMTRLQDRANRHMAPTMSKGRKARATASGGLGVVATN